MSYDIEMKRLKGTDKHCGRFEINFRLAAQPGSAQDTEIETIRQECKQLDTAAEQQGLKVDFGRAVILHQQNYQELLVSGLLELADMYSSPEAVQKMRLFEQLTRQELHHDHMFSCMTLERYLPTGQFFPDFVNG